MTSQLSFGDNLHVLRDRIGTESVDLIYLDPPFNSKRDYNFCECPSVAHPGGAFLCPLIFPIDSCSPETYRQTSLPLRSRGNSRLRSPLIEVWS